MIYCGVAKKLNINNVDFYVYMAQAFLDDKDAGEEKLSRYYKKKKKKKCPFRIALGGGFYCPQTVLTVPVFICF